MVIKTASPGVFVQEIDLTRGTSDAITQNVGVCCGPFEKGPVDQLTLVTTEVEFKNIFGGPTDENYEYWWSINNFLEYSGTCYVVRVDDEMGDAVDSAAGFGIHPQKMRNATDNFAYVPEGDRDAELEDSETTSSIYVKNQDHFFTELNGLLPTQYDGGTGERIPGTGGRFLSKTPGRWANGLAVAVIDRGADWQLTLKSADPSLTTNNVTVVTGGDASSVGGDVLDGGDSDKFLTTLPLTLDSISGIRQLEGGTKSVYPTLTTGQKVSRYAKLVFDKGDAGIEPDLQNVSSISMINKGEGISGDDNTTNSTRMGVATTTDGDGEHLMLDLALVNGQVYSFNIHTAAAFSPKGYKKGDTITTDIAGATVQAVFEVEEVTGPEGIVLQFGTVTASVMRVQYGTKVDEDGLSVEDRTKIDYVTIAMKPDANSDFGDFQPGDSIIDPSNIGSIVGKVDSCSILGDYVFYSKGGAQLVNVVWEPKTYTRNEGMEWFWPNRPFDGELVYKGKTAVNGTGIPIESENSPNPITGQPVYLTVQGPAAVTPSTGDTIVWNSRKELWQNNYIPKEDDLVIDPNNGVPYSVLRADDWYSQQVAFEGLPWRQFAKRPGTSAHAQDMGCEDDELNVIVYDAIGDATGQRGTTIEQYALVSKLKGAKTIEGSNNYYHDIFNNNSAILYANEQLNIIGDIDSGINAGRVRPGRKISADLKCAYLQPRYGGVDFRNIKEVALENVVDVPYVILGGEDQLTASLGEVQSGYLKITEENLSDLDYIIQGPSYDTTTIGNLNNTTDYGQKQSSAVAKANFLVALGEELKTAMVLISPPKCAALDPLNAGVITRKIVDWSELISSSSYAVLDSGYKYMYDRFRDKYAYVPLNADIAGTMANTSLVSQPFFSPAGLARGQIRNVVKLGYDPSKEQRDLLFTDRVNPVVTFPGEGTVLYGDKTSLAYSSAFDRINVRKLFIYCEREISKISKQVLFEFNDIPTRVSFKNNVNPFLRDIQSKRGLVDFLVVCDESNNTPEVIDRNEFVADIYIKPNRSINFVQLTFVATKSGVAFSEAVAAVRRDSGANS